MRQDAMDLAAILLEQAKQNERSGDLAVAEMLYREILDDHPDHSEASLNLGSLLFRRSVLDESLHWLRRAAEADPFSAEILTRLGMTRQALGQTDQAMRAYLTAACLQAVAFDPTDPQAYFNLGMAFNHDERHAEASVAYRKALELRPDFAESHNNLGISLQSLLRTIEAVRTHWHAVDLVPRNAGFHCNLAHALLAAGDLEEGFRQWEWRVPSPKRDFPQPLWDGSPIVGKALLAHAEQGYGDTLQFCRYLPAVAKLCGTLVVECRKPLAGLLRRMDGVAEVIEWGQPLPSFEAQVPIPSLPHLCGTRRTTIPAAIPYLRPSPERLNRWSDLVRGGTLKVGLVSAGNLHGRDPRRAVPMSELLKLGTLPGVTLFNLQKDGAPGPTETSQKPPIVDLGPLIDDFDDLAAAIDRLDLLISVDTAAAHLAGALGKPVWTLLHSAPDWRWLLDEQTTPWYPTMRLYRQRKTGDWEDLLDRVVMDLRDLAR
jgi:Flp pilus assembly protein TadD